MTLPSEASPPSSPGSAASVESVVTQPEDGTTTLELSDSESQVASPYRRPPAMQQRHQRPPLMDLRSAEDMSNAPSDAGPQRPSRPQPMLQLSGSLGSLKASLSAAELAAPGTPLPERSLFREVLGGVTLVFFDFDGTLTATPGDRAARCMKQAELRSRAGLLEPRLRQLREAGAVLGIISKSTEATIRDALVAAGLTREFEAPIIGKAIGFEGKAGIIEELLRRGTFPRLGSKGVLSSSARRRVLLVDDDVLELERARSAGFQAYAAPASGGLCESDLERLVKAVRLPAPSRRVVGTAPVVGPHGARRGAPFWAAIPPLSPKYRQQQCGGLSELREASVAGKAGGGGDGKWRNVILFSGECFEG